MSNLELRKSLLRIAGLIADGEELAANSSYVTDSLPSLISTLINPQTEKLTAALLAVRLAEHIQCSPSKSAP